MSLHFICGRTGSGKSRFCLKSAAQNNSSSDIFYIVPEQYTLQAERDIMSFTENKSIMKVQVLSFNRLSHNIFSRTGGLNNTPLDEIGKALIIRKIVSDLKDSFLYFGSCCMRSGFIEQLSDEITEFYKYNVTPKQLLTSAENTDDTVLKYKLTDLSAVYSAFISYMNSGYVSPETSLDMLYEKIDGTDFIKGSEIFIDGFFSFTPQELKVIEKLILLAKDVYITVTISKQALKASHLSPVSLFYQSKDTYNKLKEIAQIHQIKTEILFCDTIYRFRNPSLSALEKGFSFFPPAQSETCDGINIYTAQNRFDEAEHIACHILRLVRENHLKFKDIAVLTGDLENSINTIKNVFAENNIPFFADVKRPLSGFPLINLIMSLFNSVLTSLNYESIFSMLKTGLMPFSSDETELLENYVLYHGIKGYKWKSEFNYYDPHNAEEGFSEKINGLRERLISEIGIFSDKVDKNNKYTAGFISKTVFEFLELSGVLENFLSSVAEFEENGILEKAYENRQCLNALCSILDTLYTVIPEETLTLREYRDMFESAVEAKKIGIIPPQSDCVIIGDTQRSRLPAISVLFIINANDGIFPKTAPSAGVFSDTERSILSSNGITLSADSKENAFLQQFTSYMALTVPRDMLFISCLKNDFSGKQLSPSPVIDRIKKIFPSVAITDRDSAENKLLVLNSVSSAFHSLGNGLKTNRSFYSEIYEKFKTSAHWENKTYALSKALEQKKETEYLSKSSAESFFADTLYSSISRLERFSSCPYMYFMSYTINAKERPLYQLNTPDLGIIFHAVIEDFSKYLQENNISWENADEKIIEEITQVSVENEISRFTSDVFLSSNTMKYLVKRLKTISQKTIGTLINHVKKGAFTPYAFEMTFGGSGLSPIVVDLGNGRKMFLTGKVDRVDILDSDGNVYVKIIDYKSGSRSFNLQDIFYGLQLQLMIYLDAVIKSGLFQEKTVLPGGVFYFKIKNPIVKSINRLTSEDIKNLIEKELKMSGLVLMDEKVIHALDSEFTKTSNVIPISFKTDGSLTQTSSAADEKTFSAIMDYCLKTASLLGNEIIKGRVAPAPYSSGSKTPCNYCIYKSVCSFDSDTDSPRYLKALKKDEIIEIIEKSEE